ncbi:MAG: zinc metalloprotease HtpX [Candidatus Scalinduaceae bacterium]
MIKEEEIIKHRLINLVHTFLLFLGIILLLGVVAFMLFGFLGFVIMTFTLIFLIFLMPRISPHLILKMYNGKSLAYHEASRLYDILSELSIRAQLDSIPHLYYLPSKIMNAFAVGSREDAAIGITDGMLRHLNLRELTGILAHEVSHIRNNDMKVMGTADMISRLTNAFSTVGQFLLIINLPPRPPGICLYLTDTDPASYSSPNDKRPASACPFKNQGI